MFKTTTIIVIALETGINPQSPALFSVSWQVINVWRNKNKYAASCHQIHKKLICPEYFTDNIERNTSAPRLNDDCPTRWSIQKR